MKNSSLLCLAITLMFISCAARDHSFEDVPDWAKDAIWYQIFPERFRNGDPSNDPKFEDTFGSWPHDTVSAWQKSPWTSDWYELQPWEKANGKGFYYNAQRRRYGGDMQGIIDKLDYLEELGVNAIYLNPIFEAPTLHKYDTKLYHHVDDNFGPNPERDKEIWATEDFSDPSTWKWTTADSLFLKLIRKVHARDMHIIIDGVFNHVGVTHPAFVHVRKHGESSPYADWFVIKRFDDPNTPEDEFDYEGWLGVKDLPEVREVGDDLAPGPKKLFAAVVKRWMDPNGDGDPSDGIDGWRLDVSEMVPKGYWRQFRKIVREINPNAFITAELWWEDYQNNEMFNAGPWLQGDLFDSVMNYRFADAMVKFFIDTENPYLPRQLNDHLMQVQTEYPQQNNYVLMNLMDSHDTDRLASMVVNPNRMIDHECGVQQNRAYQVRKPTEEEFKTVKLIVAFQMLYIGAPMIYYGSEAGLWGADDPDERKPMVWDDLEYEVERSHPFDLPRPADPVSFDHELFDYYKTMTTLRRAHRALRRGDYRYVEISESTDVFAFSRSDDSEEILCLFNRSASDKDLSLPQRFGHGKFLYGKDDLIAADQNRYSLKGKSVVVLSR